MRKDGIQTRKRKPKKSGGISGGATDLNCKKDDIEGLCTKICDLTGFYCIFLKNSNKSLNLIFPIDIKPSLSQPSTPQSIIHHQADRNANTKIMPPQSAHKMHIPSPRTHLQSYASLCTTAHSTALTYTPSLNTPSKYDLSSTGGTTSNHNTSHHHIHHSNTSSTPAGGSYHHHHHHHSNGLPTHQSNYGNSIKSEGVASNYDYMNNCLQSGYFGSSFGSLGATAAVASAHVAAASELAGYHHQHNVIQAAKLMASS